MDPLRNIPPDVYVADFLPGGLLDAAALGERLAALEAIAHMGSWSYDLETGTVGWSAELYRLHGMATRPDAFSVGEWRELLSDETRDRAIAGLAVGVSNSEPFEVEYDTMPINGAVRTFLVRGQAVAVGEGPPRHFLGTMQDITELRLREEALRRGHALLQAVQEASPDGILVVDEHQHVIGYNARYMEIWNVPASVMATLDDNTLINFVKASVVDADAWFARIHDLYEHPAEISREEIAFVDGRVLERHSRPVLAPSGLDGQPRYYGRIWAFRDITERKRLEAALQDQNEQLRALDRMKIHFINAVSHELRAPITAIIGFAELLEEDVADLDRPEVPAHVQTIARNAARLCSLVDDLADFALMEAGVFKLRVEMAGLDLRVREAVDALGPAADKAGVQLKVDVAPGPWRLPMDEHRIAQVLTNVLTNGLKFTPKGGELVIRLLPDGPGARCEVIDAGPGIGAEDQARLFTPYTQLAAGRLKGGSGLGLAISKALIEAHGGAIGVESQAGDGATFWFTLPGPRE